MHERLLIAGSGGQGILLIGRILAGVAVKSVPHVTFFPAYGAEVRGGTSNCQVVLSSNEIASPVCEQFDSMILMNAASVTRFLPRRASECLTIVNRTADEEAPPEAALDLEATRLADDLGDTRCANLILLGAYVARKEVVPPTAVEGEISRVLGGKGPALAELNISAFRLGLSRGQER